MVKIPEARLTGAQLRAARALLNWSAQDLAQASKVSLRTIRRAEQEDGVVKSTEANTSALVAALKRRGVSFFTNPDGSVGVAVK